MSIAHLAGMTARTPHTVVLGGGFAGLQAVKTLARARARVTLIDARNHHLFQPLLYQVATGSLSSANVAQPLRRIFARYRNVDVIMSRAERIDPDERIVYLDRGSIAYDYLVVATGAQFTWFGNDQWRVRAPGLKSVDDALEIRRRLFRAFEVAECEGDAQHRREWLTFAIAGAGATGVELAGAVAEIARRALAGEYRRIDPRSARIVLIDMVKHPLPEYPEPLQLRAERQLRKLGVELRMGKAVENVTDRSIILDDGEVIAARTVLWAAGIEATPIARSLGAPLDRRGRVRVNADLSVPGRPEIFVAGDLVALECDGKPVPGLASAAIQAGRHAAQNILRTAEGKPSRRFRYRDKGEFAVIGRGAAVGRVGGRWNVSGVPAWLAWLMIHLYFLVGLQNRLIVTISWLWAYVGHQRGARVITGYERPPLVDPVPTARGATSASGRDHGGDQRAPESTASTGASA
jgi:NADH:ubiquinone reductase (H+-translocating)